MDTLTFPLLKIAYDNQVIKEISPDQAIDFAYKMIRDNLKRLITKYGQPFDKFYYSSHAGEEQPNGAGQLAITIPDVCQHLILDSNGEIYTVDYHKCPVVDQVGLLLGPQFMGGAKVDMSYYAQHGGSIHINGLNYEIAPSVDGICEVTVWRRIGDRDDSLSKLLYHAQETFESNPFFS